jgi:hypothetical protein
MIRYSVLLLLLLCAVPVFADDVVERYDLNLKINPPEGSISTEATVTLVAPEDGFDRFELLLNKNLDLQGVSSEAGVDYEFARARAGEFYYSGDSAPIVLKFHRPLRAGEEIKLSIRYQDVISETYWGENFIKPEWVEIAFYCGWFPLNPHNMNFRYEVNLEIDPAYKVTGNGLVSGGNGVWKIREDTPTNDIVVLACRDLKTRTVSGEELNLKFEYADLKEDDAERIISEVYKMVDLYSGWFEHKISQELTFVVPRRSRGGGYYRPRFFTMPFDATRTSMRASSKTWPTR